MVCPASGTSFEGRFCPQCGTDTQPYAYVCFRCGAWYNGAACPYCGTPLGEGRPGSGLRAAGSVVWSVGLVAFLLLVVLALATFLYVIALPAPTGIVQGVLASGGGSIDLYVLLPVPVGISVQASASAFLLYFAVIATAILAAHVWYGVRDARATAEAFHRPLGDLKARMESRSAWIATGQVFMAAFFFQLVFVFILLLGGFDPAPPTGSESLPEWYPYYALANASVYEEVVTRWLLIGLPLAGLATLLPSRPVPPWRHLFGGTVNRDSPAPLVVGACTMILVSSIVFGLAHVPAWGWWKFLPTVVAGLGMGYLFVRRGLLAAILFHFVNDYFAAAALLTANDLGAQVLLGLFLLFLAGLGAFFFIWYVVYIARVADHVLVKWGVWKPAPAAANPAAYPRPPHDGPIPFVPMRESGAPRGAPIPPPPHGPPPPGTIPPPPDMPWYGGGFAPFVCPSCGWREATYAEGRFTCLRCGRSA